MVTESSEEGDRRDDLDEYKVKGKLEMFEEAKGDRL